MDKTRKYKKRNLWAAGAEEQLLNLWAEKVEELRGAHRNSHIREDMAFELIKQGHMVTAAEIKVKINNLTTKYRKEKSKIGPPGEPPSEWPYYNRVHKIIGSYETDIMDDEDSTFGGSIQSQDTEDIDVNGFKRRKSEFNDEEKKYLLCSIKRRRLIWDKTNSEYNNRKALWDAWLEISQENHKSVEACRAAWKSYRDHRRYCHKKANRTGSVCDIDEFEDTCIFEITAEISDNEDSIADRDNLVYIKSEESVDSTQLAESYMPSPSPTLSQTNLLNAPAQNPVLSRTISPKLPMNNLILANPRSLVQNKSTADKAVQHTPTAKEDCKEPELTRQFKHRHLLAHLGSILEQLPNKSSNYLGAHFIAMAYEELEKHSTK